MGRTKVSIYGKTKNNLTDAISICNVFRTKLLCDCPGLDWAMIGLYRPKFLNWVNPIRARSVRDLTLHFFTRTVLLCGPNMD